MLLSIRTAAHTPNLVYYIFYSFFVTLQLCSFIGETYISYQRTSGVSEVFFIICTFLSRFPMIYGTLAAYIVSCVIVLAPILLSLVFYLLHVYASWIWPLIAAYHVLQFSTIFFYLPVSAVFVQTVFGCLDVEPGMPHPFFPQDLTCWTSTMNGLTFLSIVLMGVFLFMTNAVRSSLFPITIPLDINGKNKLLARHSNRAESYSLISQLVLLILFTSAQRSSWRGALGFLLVLVGLLQTTLQLLWLEPFSDVVALLSIFQWVVVAWLGLTTIITSLIGATASVTMFFFIGLPVMLVLSIYAMHLRYESILDSEQAQLTSGYSYVLFCRAILRAHMRAVYRDGDWIDMSPAFEIHRTTVLRTVDSVLDQAVSRFPDCPQLRYFRANYFFFVRRNRVLALHDINALESMVTPFDTRFTTYALSNTISRASDSYVDIYVQKYMEFEHIHAQTDDMLIETSRLMALLWNELLRSNPDADFLANTGHIVQLKIQQMIVQYHYILTLNPVAAGIMKHLGTLHLYLTGNMQKASMYLENAEEALIKMAENRKTHPIGPGFPSFVGERLEIFNEDNCLLTVSVAESRWGEIQESNKTTCKFFGFKDPTAMLGKSISVLMPPEIGAQHDEAMYRYLLHETSNVVDKVRMLFGIHSITGFLLPVKLYIRWSAKDRLLGVMQALHMTSNQAYLLIEPENFLVTRATESFLNIFGISRAQLFARSAFLTALFPILSDTNEDIVEEACTSMRSSAGLTTTAVHQITGQPMTVCVWTSTTTCLARPVTFARVDVLTSMTSLTRTASETSPTPLPVISPAVSGPTTTSAAPMTPFTSIPFAASPVPSTTLPFPTTSSPFPSTTLPYPYAVSPIPSTAATPMPQQQSAISYQNAENSVDLALEVPLPQANVSDDDDDRPSVHIVTYGADEYSPEHQVDPTEPVVTSDNAMFVPDATPSAQSAAARAFKLNRALRGQRQLRRAIENDGRATRRQLGVMSIVSVVTVIAMMIAAIALYFITYDEVHDMQIVITMIYDSSMRSVYIAKSLVTLSSYLFAVLAPDLLPFQYRPYVHPSMQPEVITQYIREDFLDAATNVQHLSVRVENQNINFETKQVYELRNRNVLGLEILINDLAETQYMSLKEAATTFSAMANRALYVTDTQDGTVAQTDVGFWWVAANGAKRLRAASDRMSDLLFSAFNSVRSKAIYENIWVLLVSLGITLSSTWFFIRPMVLRIEDEKNRVIQIFLDIPRTLRKSLRHKALVMLDIIAVQQGYKAVSDISPEEEDHESHSERGDHHEDSVSTPIQRYSQSRRNLSQAHQHQVSFPPISEEVTKHYAAPDNPNSTQHEEFFSPIASPTAVDAVTLSSASKRPPTGAGVDSVRADELGVSRKKAQQPLPVLTTASSKQDVVQSRGLRNFLARRSLRMFLAKYAIFVSLIVAYFLALRFLLEDTTSSASRLTQLATLSARRLSLLMTTW